jgi:hypothetical protein
MRTGSYLSVMTLGEIRQGVAALPQSKKRTRLETWLEVDLQSRFARRILAIDGAWRILGGGSWPRRKSKA